VILSRKGAKSGTHGRKLRSSGRKLKARVAHGRGSTTRLQQQLEARTRELAEARVAQGTVQNYDFSGARHIVDVGGADGGLLLAILDANPQLRGTVFDQPHVAEAAREAIHAKNHQARCEFVGGDFFQSVPAGADVYVLKFILVDWRDEEGLRILQNCRTAIAPDGKLLVIEMTIPDDNRPSAAQLFDLNMLVMTGGQERMVSEYGALLAKAGFRLTRVIPTGSPFHVLEAVGM
jgi:O-methyltransferase domain